MKNILIILILSTIGLSSCGGSGGDTATETSTSESIVKLSNTSWEKECSSYNKLSSDELTDAWNVKIKLSIDASLKATYRTEYFHPADTACESMMFDALDISNIEIIGKIVSEESIAANGLNETFIYHSENRAFLLNYTLIYIHSEKLYFGHKSGENHGETAETRHSSISLDHYFTQIINE